MPIDWKWNCFANMGRAVAIHLGSLATTIFIWSCGSSTNAGQALLEILIVAF